jgi:hypothetical protein
MAWAFGVTLAFFESSSNQYLIMYKFKLLNALVLVLFISAFQSDKIQVNFKDQLAIAGMMIDMPKGFVETKIISNQQMNYEYAIKHPEKNFEVRYAIRPLGELIKSYNENEKNKKPGDININPNQFFASSFQATCLNISGGQMPRVNQFPKQAVKSEFNADWGATTFMKVGKEFGQQYQFCMLVAIHKDNLADAYIFYLSDKQETISELVEPVFHSLKFK